MASSPSLRRMRVVVVAIVALALLCASATVLVLAVARNAYEVLGVTRDATTQQIKKAYRHLALELHPDKLGRNATEEDHSAFVELVAAYEILSDEEARHRYDTYGPEESGPGQAYVMKNYKLFPFDMYIRIPGGAFEFHWRPKSKPEAPVIHAHVAISLAEMYTGVIRQVVVARQRFCGVCNGTGAASHEHSHTCNACRGTGRHLYLQEHDSGYAHVMNSTCEYCKGTGTVPNETCHHCGGSRLAAEEATLNVTVPPGAASGYEVVLPGAGHQRLGHLDGPVRVSVSVVTDKRFRVTQEGDLEYTARISLLDSLLGFTRRLTLPNGKKLQVTHDTVTFSGYQQTYPGHGPPRVKNPAEHGAIIVEFVVVFPRRLTDEQREVLRDVINEEDIEVLEAVIRLETARDAEAAGRAMPLEETLYSSACDPGDPFVCLPDAIRALQTLAKLGGRRRSR